MQLLYTSISTLLIVFVSSFSPSQRLGTGSISRRTALFRAALSRADKINEIQTPAKEAFEKEFTDIANNVTAPPVLVKGIKWPGNRPPLPCEAYFTERMEATWGRGKFREEIWNDIVNPVNDWWLKYAPSEEEIEAIELGYEISNPQKYFEVIIKKLNYL